MIKYQLICNKGHEFEGWFQTSSAFDEQSSDGLLRCPLCDSDKVKRALMTPNLASPKRRRGDETKSYSSEGLPSTPLSEKSPKPAPKPDDFNMVSSALAELRQLQKKITSECRDVGNNFAEEARKMHYGEADVEGIYGQTTSEERDALNDEGIEVFDLPWLPPDH